MSSSWIVSAKSRSAAVMLMSFASLFLGAGCDSQPTVKPLAASTTNRLSGVTAPTEKASPKVSPNFKGDGTIKRRLRGGGD